MGDLLLKVAFVADMSPPWLKQVLVLHLDSKVVEHKSNVVSDGANGLQDLASAIKNIDEILAVYELARNELGHQICCVICSLSSLDSMTFRFLAK